MKKKLLCAVAIAIAIVLSIPANAFGDIREPILITPLHCISDPAPDADCGE